MKSIDYLAHILSFLDTTVPAGEKLESALQIVMPGVEIPADEGYAHIRHFTYKRQPDSIYGMIRLHTAGYLDLIYGAFDVTLSRTHPAAIAIHANYSIGAEASMNLTPPSLVIEITRHLEHLEIKVKPHD